ncbi:MAG TPA: hypothetical protein VJH55_02135 [Candidatus Paceibacterota bacterium]
MLNIKRLAPQPPAEKTVKLGTVPKGQGNLIRFAEIPFDDAVKEGAFYFVLDSAPPTHKDLVHLMPIDGKAPLLRDNDRTVVIHEYEMAIKP